MLLIEPNRFAFKEWVFGTRLIKLTHYRQIVGVAVKVKML